MGTASLFFTFSSRTHDSSCHATGTQSILDALKNNPQIHRCIWKSSSIWTGGPHESHTKAKVNLEGEGGEKEEEKEGWSTQTLRLGSEPVGWGNEEPYIGSCYFPERPWGLMGRVLPSESSSPVNSTYSLGRMTFKDFSSGNTRDLLFYCTFCAS